MSATDTDTDTRAEGPTGIETTPRRPAILRPSQGRRYDMGRMQATFRADGDETAGRYSISEWRIEARTRGPGTHAHDDDHLYVVLAGTLHVSLAGAWGEAPAGSVVLIPGGTPHDFENRADADCTFLTINTPAGFEENLPSLVEWFAANPLERL